VIERLGGHVESSQAQLTTDTYLWVLVVWPCIQQESRSLEKHHCIAISTRWL